jgi:acetyl-CoA carboxylase alpha subunit
MGGAHRDPNYSAELVRDAIRLQLERLTPMAPHALVEARVDKFLRMGVYGAGG